MVEVFKIPLVDVFVNSCQAELVQQYTIYMHICIHISSNSQLDLNYHLYIYIGEERWEGGGGHTQQGPTRHVLQFTTVF